VSVASPNLNRLYGCSLKPPDYGFGGTTWTQAQWSQSFAGTYPGSPGWNSTCAANGPLTNQVCKVYLSSGQYPTTLGAEQLAMVANGVAGVICFNPTYESSGNYTSQVTALLATVAAYRAGGMVIPCVVLVQEGNNGRAYTGPQFKTMVSAFQSIRIVNGGTVLLAFDPAAYPAQTTGNLQAYYTSGQFDILGVDIYASTMFNLSTGNPTGNDLTPLININPANPLPFDGLPFALFEIGVTASTETTFTSEMLRCFTSYLNYFANPVTGTGVLLNYLALGGTLSHVIYYASGVAGATPSANQITSDTDPRIALLAAFYACLDLAASPTYLIGAESAPSGGSTVTITSVNATNPGDLLLIGGGASTTTVPTGVSDPEGNTWRNAVPAAGGTSPASWLWYASNGPGGTGPTVPVPASSPYVITYAGGTVAKNAVAVGWPGGGEGASVVDVAVAANGTGTGPSLASGALAAASELTVAVTTNANAGGSPAQGGTGWTQQAVEHNASNAWTALATQVAPSTSSLTAQDTITSAAWTMVLAAFKAAVGSPVITVSGLPPGVVGVAYSTTLTASGGTPPYTWAVTSGSLPPGLSLTASGASAGLVSGTPTTAGSYPLGVTVTDSASETASASLAITIAASALSVTTTSPLPGGMIGFAYGPGGDGVTLAATGGTSPYAWSIISDPTQPLQNLPAGLTLAGGTGLISGIPAATGSYDIVFAVQDINGLTAQATLALLVSSAGWAPPVCMLVDDVWTPVVAEVLESGSWVVAGNVSTLAGGVWS
jgi:hypothetical protein